MHSTDHLRQIQKFEFNDTKKDKQCCLRAKTSCGFQILGESKANDLNNEAKGIRDAD